MLIEGQINIDELPEAIRISSRFYVNYVRAVRGSRDPSSAKLFVRTLIRMDKDIEQIRTDVSLEEANEYDDFLMYNVRQMFEIYREMADYDDYLAKQQRKRPLLYNAYFGRTSGDNC